jgi:multidrug efflux pump subunit AcrA (membrane-fusion protein)
VREERVVHYGDFQTKLPETGVVQLPRTVTIPAGVAGNMGEIAVRAGDRVAEGQLLGTIVNDQIVLERPRRRRDRGSRPRAKAQSVAERTRVAGAKPLERAPSRSRRRGARSQLTQAAKTRSGSQSGLGYGGTTAEEQRLGADTTLSKAATDLREAKRTYDADKSLYNQKRAFRAMP